MDRYVAFIRGINVGGIVLKMDLLREILADLGHRDISTYIQSGNALFTTVSGDLPGIERDIRAGIRIRTGLDPAVIVKAQEEVKRIAAAHPFESEGDSAKLYVTLLHGIPDKGMAATMTKAITEPDKALIHGDLVYSYYGQGYGKSKFSNNYIESALKLDGTTRNWKTMKKLAAWPIG